MRNAELDIDYSDLSWGKYDSSMAKYLYERVMMNGDFGDEEVQTGDMEGTARYGRRTLAWDNRGFVSSATFDTVEYAEAYMKYLYEQTSEQCRECGEMVQYGEWEVHECEDEPTCPQCGSHGHTNTLTCDLLQAERLIGTE